jgi:hypothetical protein
MNAAIVVIVFFFQERGWQRDLAALSSEQDLLGVMQEYPIHAASHLDWANIIN